MSSSVQSVSVDPSSESQITPTQIEVLPFRGVNYGHYHEGGPGTGEIVPLELIENDLEIMKNLGVTDLRTYRLSDGLENLPILSLEYGITTAALTWIAPNMSNASIFGGIDEALSFENYTSMTILGNEPLLRGEYTASEYQEFIDYANEKKSPATKIALAEPYYIYLNNPSLVANVSTLMVHIYPAWEGKTIDEAAQYTVEKFLEVREAYPDKELYLGEFGWPSGPEGQFNEANQKRYYDEVLPLIAEYDIKPYIFQIFDEDWKNEVYNGLEIGPHWGVFEEFRQGKPASETIAAYFGGETIERIDFDPEIFGPGTIETTVGASITIQWAVRDLESPSGTYSLYKNNFLLISNIGWLNNTSFDIIVDTSAAGEFEYRLEVKDRSNTVSDTVVVTVVDPNATTSSTTEETPLLIPFSLIPLLVMLRKRRD
jgi:exo-beta-1,3-glucanase (GH17 family)